MPELLLLFDPVADGDPLPEGVQRPARLGLHTDNFLLIWADAAGLHVTTSGPGPWELVREQLGRGVNLEGDFLSWTRAAEVEPEP